MVIREEREEDIEQITAIHDRAFSGPEEGKIVERLRKNNHLTISLIVESDRKLVAHIAYSPMYNKNREIIGIGLAPVAVMPSCQRKGIGSRLIEKGNEIAFARGFSKIFVLGDPEYYRRFGFKIAKNYNYFSSFDPEGKHFMVMGRPWEKAAEMTAVDYCAEFGG
jgi:putative acetyltransferase